MLPSIHVSPTVFLCRVVEAEVKLLLEAALAVARDCVTTNRPLHDALSAELRQEERVEGAALQVRGRVCLVTSQIHWVCWVCACPTLRSAALRRGEREEGAALQVGSRRDARPAADPRCCRL